MRYTALAVAAVAAALSIPAVAEEAAPTPICAETMEHVISMIEAKGGEYISLTGVELVAFAERVAPITGVPAGEVTGALIVEFGGVPVFGIEMKDGCFSPGPIPLPVVPAGVRA